VNPSLVQKQSHRKEVIMFKGTPTKAEHNAAAAVENSPERVTVVKDAIDTTKRAVERYNLRLLAPSEVTWHCYRAWTMAQSIINKTQPK
jgi:hypothetical protein